MNKLQPTGWAVAAAVALALLWLGVWWASLEAAPL